MTWQTTGYLPTEFDPTTDAVLRTVQAIGVTDEQLAADQKFVYDTMTDIGAGEENPLMDVIAGMDCLLIGVVYHRHFPWIDPDTDEYEMPDRGEDYVGTLNFVLHALRDQVGISPEAIFMCLEAGSDRGVTLFRKPDVLTNESLVLHVKMLAAFNIGWLIHHLMPKTNENPAERK